jgi:hypothetical protein
LGKNLNYRNPVGKKPGFDGWEKTLITETRLGKNRVSTVGEKPGFVCQKPGWQKTGFRRLGKNRVSRLGKNLNYRNPVGKKPGFVCWEKTGFLKQKPSNFP